MKQKTLIIATACKELINNAINSNMIITEIELNHVCTKYRVRENKIKQILGWSESNYRITKENYLWMKDNNISPTKMFRDALDKLKKEITK